MKLIKRIPVNTECYVDREYPAGNSSYEYLVISSTEGDKKDGFVHAVFGFDMESDCCEDFKVRCDPRIFGEYSIHAVEIYEEEIDTEDEVSGKLIVSIDAGEEEYVWVASNSHNGYYAHSISVKVTESGGKKFEYNNHY